MKDPAEAVAEDESDGYVLDMRDGSDLERGSDFEVASNERRRMVRLRFLWHGGKRRRVRREAFRR